MRSSQAIPDPASTDEDRVARVEQVVAGAVARRASGEPVADARLIAEHPDLSPDLAEALRVAADVRRAYLAAQRAGEMGGGDAALDLLSDAELDAPIPGAFAEPVAEAPPRMPGYEILCAMPRGGQASVYLARRTSTGRRVAVKVLADGRFASPRARRRFDREADVLAALDHPHLVSVIDAGTTDDGAPFLVMPYIDGWSLDEYLAVPPAIGGLGGAEAGPVLALFERLARAVHAAHVAGVIHRDLKPTNIRVDRNGEPRVLDFGLARLSDPVEGQGDGSGVGPRSTLTREQILGTPGWMSPEQAAGMAADVDGRADVYALGVMLYRALAGRSPYPEESPPHRVLAHVLGTMPTEPSRSAMARPGVDRRVDAVVMKCLAKNRDDRYATAADLADDLAVCRQGGPPLALLDYTILRAARPNRQGAWAWATAAATVAVAAAVWEGYGLGMLGAGKPVFLAPAPHPLVTPGPASLGRRPNTFLNFSAHLFFVQIQPAAYLARGAAPDRHRMVVVDHTFWIGVTEVTRAQYATVMGQPIHDLSPADGQLPVTGVTRAEAAEFCRVLGLADRHRYRLPTVAEWELAARCGRNDSAGGGLYGAGPTAGDARAGAVDADAVCWNAGNSGGHAHPVMTRRASRFTLSDMNGNVAEWCDDGGADRARGTVCGGAYDRPAERCVNDARESLSPDERRLDVGFRVVMEGDPDAPTKK